MLKRIIEDHGCKLEFLPPYSPDYNPIEYSFSVLKRALKSHWQLRGDESVEEFADVVLKAGMFAVTGAIARNQFRHCHIHVPE
jgi:transposase